MKRSGKTIVVASRVVLRNPQPLDKPGWIQVIKSARSNEGVLVWRGWRFERLTKGYDDDVGS